jgi:hypothetical protein
LPGPEQSCFRECPQAVEQVFSRIFPPPGSHIKKSLLRPTHQRIQMKKCAKIPLPTFLLLAPHIIQ